MSTTTLAIKAVETATGHYELRQVRRTYWTIWSLKTSAPLGTYEDADEAARGLNSIRVGQPLPKDPGEEPETLEDLVEIAQTLCGGWEAVQHLDLPVSEKLLRAIIATEDSEPEDSAAEQCRMLARLALDALQMERAAA